MSSRVFLILMVSALIGFAIPAAAIPADEGVKIFTETCSPCHMPSVQPLDDKHLTREQWKEAIDRMIDLGSQVPKGKK